MPKDYGYRCEAIPLLGVASVARAYRRTGRVVLRLCVVLLDGSLLSSRVVYKSTAKASNMTPVLKTGTTIQTDAPLPSARTHLNLTIGCYVVCKHHPSKTSRLPSIQWQTATRVTLARISSPSLSPEPRSESQRRPPPSSIVVNVATRSIPKPTKFAEFRVPTVRVTTRSVMNVRPRVRLMVFGTDSSGTCHYCRWVMDIGRREGSSLSGVGS